MGGAASGKVKPEVRKRRYRNAVLAIGSFAKHTNQERKQQRRHELIMNIERMKLENHVDYEVVAKSNENPLRFSQRAGEAQDPDLPADFLRDSDKPAWAAYDSDERCWLCRKPADDEAHPCRVCTRIFHQRCLELCGECRKVDARLTYRSRSNTGWCCYICSNLSLVLEDTEIEELIEMFENYDVNKDGVVSWEEFRLMKCRLLEQRQEEPLSEFDHRLINVDFNIADVDGDGTLDWWEFLNHEAKTMLTKRNKIDLVNLLTEKELLVAKALFRTLDKNGDGNVTELETREAFRHWFRHFEDETKEQSMGKESSSLELHVELNTKLTMYGDSSDREVLTWPVFLMDQCLYLVCNRPNITYTIHS